MNWEYDTELADKIYHNDLPDLETVKDILLELEDTGLYNIEYFNCFVNTNKYYISKKVNYETIFSK